MGEPVEVHIFGGKIGESILLKLPGNLWGVVDTYTPNLANPRSNPAFRFLEDHRVSRLHFLCLTHPHLDHYKGMRHFLDHFDPDRIWIFGALTHRDLHAKVAEILRLKATSANDEEDQSESADELVRILDKIRDKVEDRSRTPRVDVRRLQLEQRLLDLNGDPPLVITSMGAPGGLTMLYERSLVSCFDGNGDFLAAKVPSVNHNLISGGLLIEYGRSRIILGGDMETDSWKEAMACFGNRGRLDSVLVKASHHGSTTGYCEGLWALMSPRKSAVAVITPYTLHSLPSPAGLSHVMDHAAFTLAASLPAVALATDWVRQTQETTYKDVSVDALLALRSLFPKAHAPTDRLEGRCSFFVSDDGSVKFEADGQAGPITKRIPA